LPGHALDADPAAQDSNQFFGDGKPESGAAEAACQAVPNQPTSPFLYFYRQI